MNLTQKLFAVSLGMLMASCTQTTNKQDDNMKENLSIDKSDMDLTIKPGENFYLYSNGNWINNNPVPSDKTQYGSFTVIDDNNQKQLKELVLGVAKTKGEKGTNAQKIADFYNSGMDTVKINKEGIAPILGDLERIDRISNTDELVVVIAQMHTEGYDPVFYFTDTQDSKNSAQEIGIIYQGGLSLPDVDYYLSEDERILNIKSKFKSLVSKMFAFAGADEKTAQNNSEIVLNFETKLAKNSFTRLEERDPFTNYNKVNLEELKALSPVFNWDIYFNTIGLTRTEEINAAQKKFVTGISNLTQEVSLEEWKVYLKWNVINSASGYLSDNFEKASFDFYGGVLSGQQEMKARWKRVLSTTDNALGEALGQLYVEKYFPPQAKERMVKLVENLKIAFANRINNAEWMQDSTKQRAIEKLNAIMVKVGYPDKWKDYTHLEISAESYFGNVKASRQFYFADAISKIGKPYDKSQWGMSPQTVNAYYSPNSNEIVFPAAILQAPFFYMDADDAVNYGGIGVVIGHEMTHGFDDQGRNFDKDGNLNNWWTEVDSKAFDSRKLVVIEQYNQFIELDSLHVDGELTVGENIADLGGLNIALDGFMLTEQGQANQDIEGFNPQQRFFLSYSKLWRQNILTEELTRRLKEDVHSPGDARVNAALFNIDQFYSSFDIQEKDKFFIPKDKRANIW